MLSVLGGIENGQGRQRQERSQEEFHDHVGGNLLSLPLSRGRAHLYHDPFLSCPYILTCYIACPWSSIDSSTRHACRTPTSADGLLTWHVLSRTSSPDPEFHRESLQPDPLREASIRAAYLPASHQLNPDTRLGDIAPFLSKTVFSAKPELNCFFRCQTQWQGLRYGIGSGSRTRESVLSSTSTIRPGEANLSTHPDIPSSRLDNGPGCHSHSIRSKGGTRLSTTHAEQDGPEDTRIVLPSHTFEQTEAYPHFQFYLSGPCVLLSLLITLWTLLSLALVMFLQPPRLCSKQPPFRDQLVSFLAPSLSLQLHFIHSSHPPATYSAPLLLLIHILSPIAAMGVAVASWTAGCFWFFSAILGDPAGQDGHNDGRATVLGVRNWWERWLSRALR